MKINICESKQIFLKIYDNAALLESCCDFILKNEKLICKHMKFIKRGLWSKTMKENPFIRLCVVVAYLPLTLEIYREKGIPEEIFYKTMNDIKIWIDDYKSKTGKDGLHEINWIRWHLQCKVFTIGRLQYHLVNFYNSTYKKNGIKIKMGSKIVNLHIPRGEPLTQEKCDESFDLAKKFIETYFPKYPSNIFICHSWLLYSKNKYFMQPKSNIIQFASKFDIVLEKEAPSQAFLWLFQKDYTNGELIANRKKSGTYFGFSSVPKKSSPQIKATNEVASSLHEDIASQNNCANVSFSNFPQNSMLQKNVVNYIANGGELGDSLGIYIHANN